MRRTKKENNSSFTLIELIIVTALIAVISLAVYSTFNNGIKLWQRVNRQGPEEDLAIFLDKFAFDIRNTFKFTGMPFIGKPEGFELATLLNSQDLKARTVGRVAYFYDPQTELLYRQEKDFSQLYQGKDGSIIHSLSNIKSVKFSYYFYDKETKNFIWLEEWAKEGLPQAVRIELNYNDGKEDKNVTKSVSITVAG